MNNSSRSPRVSRGVLILIVCMVCLVLILGVLGGYRMLSRRQEAPAEMDSVEVTLPVETQEPEESAPRANYTVSDDECQPKLVVARAGDAELTNRQLQVLYLCQVAAHQTSGDPVQPDYTQPLENQPCPLTADGRSWQHYFLENALSAWQRTQALLWGAQQPRKIAEAEFQPDLNMDLHGNNIAPDLPVNHFLYQDQPCFKPNTLHQAYLDNMEALLGQLVQGVGSPSLRDYGAAHGIEPAALVEIAQDYNLAYMYFTECSYEITADADAVKQYIAVHDAELPDREDYTVNLRHILLIPKDAKVASDGSVTADEAQWKKCEETAKSTIQSWLMDYPTNMIPDGKNVNFSRFAFHRSADDGSSLNGGLYANVRPGQLNKVLDAWCFDPARQPNDYEILRTEAGVHIVFFVGKSYPIETAAAEALVLAQQEELWDTYLREIPLTVDYENVQLWVDCQGALISLADTLYPDVTHERFPEAMVYLQQDYPNVSYGSSTVSRGGCGITTMAMLATYMTDRIITPAMLAKDYSNYHDENGTMAEMFRYVPAELGFHLLDTSSNVQDVIDALQINQRVVSLQHLGHFTRGGHYLLLQQYYPDDDTFQVRDSNIANYSRLDGHKVDYFTRANILSGGAIFYLFPEKVITTPSCARCGTGSSVQSLILQDDYLCQRCITASARRANFLILAG